MNTNVPILDIETYAADGCKRVAGKPGATAALGQQEVPQSVRHGPERPLVHSMQMEEGVHSLRRLARAPQYSAHARFASQMNALFI